jgi:hypothetical protein
MTDNLLSQGVSDDGGEYFHPAANARPLLIALVVISLATGPILVLQGIWSDYPWSFLFVYCFVVALESVFTARWMIRKKHHLNAPAIVAAEIIITLVVLRIITWLINEDFPNRRELFQILRHPEAIFDGFFLITAFISVFVLLRAHSLTRLFARLSLDKSEIRYSRRTGKYNRYGEEHSPALTDRQALIQQYYRGWVLGGVVLIVCVAISTFDLADLGERSTPISSIRNLLRIGLRTEMLVTILVYFIGGLSLASEGRLVMLSARWAYEGVKVENRVSTSWRRNAILLLCLIALIAAFLPIGSTIGLSGLIEAIVWVILALVGLIGAILSLIYMLILSGLMSLTQTEAQPPVAPPNIVPDIPQISDSAREISTLLVGSVFWIILFVISLISIVYFTKNRDLRINRNDIGRWWTSFVMWIMELWRTLFHQVGGIAAVAGGRLPKSQGEEVGDQERWRFVRLSNLSPRDKIRYYYLSTVRRAGTRGVRRQEQETPNEYLQGMMNGWPEIAEEMDDLTESFIIARYSDQQVMDPEANLAKITWKRIRLVLRKRARK